MLQRLQIRNLAVIDALDLELCDGFTVLTGETGAGKSILIDAVGLVLGARADSSLVRAGTAQAEVIAEFRLAGDAPAVRWLQAQDLSDADEPERCVIRRSLQAEGRTRAFINDRPVGVGALRELGDCLVEVFGQGESQTLMRADVQRDLLDACGTTEAYRQALDATAHAAREYLRVEAEIARLRGAGERDPAQIEFLRYQLNELEALALGTDELDALEAEHKRLSNAGRLLSDGGAACDALFGGEPCIYDQLATLGVTLAELARLHPGFTTAADCVAAAQAQVHEAADELRGLLDRLDLDPERLQDVEQRMAAIHDLARKHRLRAADLPDRREALTRELADMEGGAEALAALHTEQQRLRQHYDTAANELTTLRRAAASQLATEVTAQVQQLGMANAVFEIVVEPAPAARPSVHGDDTVRFDFSANPGQPPRALSKVASGGELSRIGLSLQVAALQAATVSTMIFDEVDAGIGGGVAEIVGTRLRALGEHRQVLCVTHLAQVAAQGQQHLHIRKTVKDDQTYTSVSELDAAGRVAELARMAGGRTITRATEAHARELLGKAGGKR